jgi:ornithine carbamoyltransferase
MSEKARDLLALSDLCGSDIMAIIERAQDMAALWKQRRMVQSLAGHRFALVVNDSGWRNTTAFDLGIQAMGGICTHAPLRWDTREDVADLAAYLDNWFDGIITRAPELTVIRSLANAARAPVINARTRQNHPCETLGDLAFLSTDMATSRE